MDYRFCPEPDLPPLLITDEHVEALKATLPELPEATMARFCRDYGLPEHLSRLIVCAAGGASGALHYMCDCLFDESSLHVLVRAALNAVFWPPPTVRCLWLI